MALNGNGTAVPKVGLESYFSYVILSTEGMQTVGEFICSEAGSGTYTAEADPAPVFATGGENLFVRCTVAIESLSAIGVTITGTKAGGGAATGTVTIPAQSGQDQSFEVVLAVAGETFVTVTGITISNGVAGDAFEIIIKPDMSGAIDMNYVEGLDVDPGIGVKDIWTHYDVGATKKTRGNRRISVNGIYETAARNLSKINGRNILLIEEVKDDGGASITETSLYDKARLTVKRNVPGDENEVKEAAEGSYTRKLHFS